jgi:hypothetical protein
MSFPPGTWRRSSLRTVSPPTPESKTPIALSGTVSSLILLGLKQADTLVSAPVKVKIYGGFLALVHFPKNVSMFFCNFDQAATNTGDFKWILPQSSNS